MIGNLWLVHATGDRWKCGQPESNFAKEKEAIQLPDVAFNDESLVTQKTVQCEQWGNHHVDLVGWDGRWAV